MSAPEVREVPIDELSLGIQSREAINEGIVAEYAEAMADGYGDFPPIEGYGDDDGNIHPADGHHRILAARKAGHISIPVLVRPGGQAAAEWAAAGANTRHGLRRTTADKERAIRMALRHPRGRELSNVLIAQHVGCSDKTVAKYRAEMVAASEIPRVSKRRGADGKSYPTVSRRAEAEPQPTGGDPEPLLPFDPDRHAESPEEPDDAPVSPASPDPGTTPPADATGAHTPVCATCGAEPCACSRVATPDGEPDPDAPPEIDDDAPPWAGGAADTEVEQLLEAVDLAPDGLTEDGQRKAWCTLREHIGPVLDGIDEHRRSFASLVERPLLDARNAIMNDTVAANFARAGRVFAGVDTSAHEALEALDKLRHAVAHMMPHAVCRECSGARCGHCQDRGFIFAAEASQREPAR